MEESCDLNKKIKKIILPHWLNLDQWTVVPRQDGKRELTVTSDQVVILNLTKLVSRKQRGNLLVTVGAGSVPRPRLRVTLHLPPERLVGPGTIEIVNERA